MVPKFLRPWLVRSAYVLLAVWLAFVSFVYFVRVGSMIYTENKDAISSVVGAEKTNGK
ncbi:MAG: hypothetical protein AAB353_04165 [Candidatus Hydrogenedentota bacterium]|mgnify:CR=1 FL=1